MAKRAKNAFIQKNRTGIILTHVIAFTFSGADEVQFDATKVCAHVFPHCGSFSRERLTFLGVGCFTGGAGGETNKTNVVRTRAHKTTDLCPVTFRAGLDPKASGKSYSFRWKRMSIRVLKPGRVNLF